VSFEFDEEWLKNAVQIEDEANCNIQAGLDLGQNLDIYISEAKSYINCKKLTVVLEESLVIMHRKGFS
jgi:hypothetical protein